ncbi:TonB-dependent receptor domain-containing protein [Candidatus Methylobacter favarea]|nr:TonB-dependent receptor [Candidatus Methylobacter favarea]
MREPPILPIRPGIFWPGSSEPTVFEFGLAADLLPAWSLSATCAYLDAEVTKPNNRATGLVRGISKSLEGKISVNVPENSGVGWASYLITPEWEIGGGVSMASSGFSDTFNEVALPGYARLNATVAYHRKYFDIQTNVFNLLDKVYYESGQTNTSLAGDAAFGANNAASKY